MSHYVFVESNTTGTGRLAVERLVAAGERVSFVTASAQRYPFLATAAGGLRVVACDTNDAGAIEACLRELARDAAVDAVLTFSTFYVAIVADVAARLGLPALAPGAALTCHHKDRCRAALARAGLPAPAFRVVTGEAEAAAAAREVGYPCVVKPAAESGSSGVLQVDSAEQLVAHVRALTRRTTNERGQPLPREVLIESLLIGPEFSVETFTFAGATRVVGVTQKLVSDPPHFVELGHTFPAALDATTGSQIERAVRDGLAAVGFDHGPAHTELRVTASGPVIIEINPRLAGGMIPELVRRATGIDLLRATLDAARGHAPALAATRHEVAGIRFFTAPRAGVLRELRGAERARERATVCELRLDKPIGAEVVPARSALDRLGYVIAAGPDRAAVVDDLAAALAMVSIEID